MQPHTKIYMRFMGYDTSDFIPCEVCGDRATDTHHIEARGMGGDPKGKKDVIENLMALCRSCHEKYGDIKEFKPYLTKIHNLHMKRVGMLK
jgi:hypothetical protein